MRTVGTLTSKPTLGCGLRSLHALFNARLARLDAFYKTLERTPPIIP